VIGDGANVVVDNCVRPTYSRGGGSSAAGWTPSYLGPDEIAPLVWEPEFLLGQLSNTALFLQGYVLQIRSFAQCVLNGDPPTRGGLEDAWHVTRLLEAFRDGKEGVRLQLRELPLPVPA
jgi:hypothetical protein